MGAVTRQQCPGCGAAGLRSEPAVDPLPSPGSGWACSIDDVIHRPLQRSLELPNLIHHVLVERG